MLHWDLLLHLHTHTHTHCHATLWGSSLALAYTRHATLWGSFLALAQKRDATTQAFAVMTVLQMILWMQHEKPYLSVKHLTI